MKTLILTLTLAALAASPLTARAEDKKPDGPKRPDGAGRPGGPGGGRMNPEERLKKMTETLGLNQEQQDKIKKIFEDGQPEMAKLRDVPEDQRRAKFGEFMKAQNEKILAVLTPEQQEKYKAAMAERMKQAGDRKPGDEPRKPREGGKPPGDGGAKPDGSAKPDGAKPDGEPRKPREGGTPEEKK